MHVHLLSQTERVNFLGITTVPWKQGKCWCGIPHAQTHTPHLTYHMHATREAGAVAQRAERQKISKYAHLNSNHHFMLVAVETSGVFGLEALSFIQDLSQHLRQVTGEPRSLAGIPSPTNLSCCAAGKCSCCSWDNGKVSWTGNFFWLNVHCYLFVCLYVVFVSVLSSFILLLFFYIASSVVLSVLFFLLVL